MSFFKFSSFAPLAILAVASVTGCAAATEDAADSTQDELTARPRIELPITGDEASIQAKLWKLLSASKGDESLNITGKLDVSIDVGSLKMTGGSEPGVRRAVACNASSIEMVGPGGSGFMRMNRFDCALTSFDPVRNGAVLPSVIVPFQGTKPLAAKLFAILENGEAKGLGVTKTGGEHPGCCDIPTVTTYTIADADASLSCTMHAGGLAGIQRVECAYVKSDTN